MKLSKLFIVFSFVFIALVLPISEQSIFGSQVAVYYFIQCFVLFYFILFFNKIKIDNSIFYILIFYLVIQVFVLLSIFLSPLESMRGVRAVTHGSLSVITFGFLALVFYDAIGNPKIFFKAFRRFVLFFSLVSFSYFTLEIYSLFNSNIKSVVFQFYKNESEGIVSSLLTSFFGQSYFAGFVFSQLFVLSSAFWIYGVKGFRISSFLLFILTVSTQSKTALFSVVLSLFILYFFKRPQRAIASCLIIFTAVILFVSATPSSQFERFVNQSGLYFLKSSYNLVTSHETSGTLNTRVSQIDFALSVSERKSWLVGGGEINDTYLESLPAKFIAKNGLLAFLLYVVGILLIVKLSFIKSLFLLNNKKRGTVIAGATALLFTFPLQMSSLMFNWSKPGIIFSFVFAITLFSINRKSREV